MDACYLKPSIMYFIIIACSTACPPSPAPIRLCRKRVAGNRWPLGITRLPCYGCLSGQNGIVQLADGGWLDWQTNVVRSKQELCLSWPGARSRGEEGRRTRLRHEEGGVCRPHVPGERGSPGQRASFRAPRPVQTGTGQVGAALHDGFCFGKAKRCQQTHVHT